MDDHRGSRRPGAGLLLVLAVAALLRVVVYAEIAEGPWPHLQAWTQSDMHFFDRWARAIASGDLFTTEDMRPYHGRHRKLACMPATTAPSEPAACDDDRVRATWDDWVGPRTFWQDPLYPYLLAVLYSAVGFAAGPGAAWAFQSLLGLACVGLVYGLTLRIFGARAAVAAGSMAALFGPLLMYETVLLRAVPLTFFGLLACWLLVLTVDGRRGMQAFAAGVASGALCLLKMSGLLTVMLWAVFLPLAADAKRRVLTAAFLAGLLVAISPLVARNLVVGTPPLQGAATGPLNFLNGNAVDRTAGGGSAVSALAAPILHRTGGDGRAVIFATIGSHERFRDWLALLAAKLAAFFDAREVPNNVNYRYFLLQTPWLAHLVIGFPLVLGLAAVGVWEVRFARAHRGWFPLIHVVTGIATCVLFFNLSRFRLPVALMMIPFAGAGYACVVSRLREHRWPAAAAAAGTAVAVALASVALGPATGEIRIADYGVANEITEHLALRSAAERGVDAAITMLEKELETEPSALTGIEPGPTPTRVSVEDAGIAGTFVGLHELLAELAAKAGRDELASTHRRRAGVLRALNRPYEGAVGR